MHEIGHNLGFAHSNEQGTYKDQSGMMGYSYGGSNTPIMCFNGTKSWQSRLYSELHLTITSTAASNNCYDGEIYGISDFQPGSSNHVIIVKIDGLNSANSYFVNFNMQMGINSETQEVRNQVMVTQTGNEGTSCSESELLSKLGFAGVSYTITNFASLGKNVAILLIKC